jgi:hypothetical protein
MSLVLNGTTGITSPGGDSAAVSVTTPLVTNAGTLALSATGANIVTASTNATERMRITSAGNVGIGTTSPIGRLDVVGNYARFFENASGAEVYLRGYFGNANLAAIQVVTNSPLAFLTNNAERMRIDSSGNLLVGTTSAISSTNSGIATFIAAGDYAILDIGNTRTTSQNTMRFFNGNGQVGSISTNASATAYNTSSDYRLKHDIQPMTGALAKVTALKPVTYKWNADDSQSQGFIAHELQEVVPECVTGEKDAVDADGNPEYQGIDTSFLVATLTAALQEAVAEINSLKARVEALEGAQIV